MQKSLDLAAGRTDEFVEQLMECLRIPSVGTRPEHKEDTTRCADWIVAHLHAMGITGVEALRTQGHPMITGEHVVDPSLPTLLVYGHYDVQPAEPLDLWDSPPFEPEVRDGNIYARGAVDDKGQLFMVLGAIQCCIESEEGLPVNLKFAIEGEEESGSESLMPFLESYRDKLGADALLVCDTSMVDPSTPTLTASLRGMVYVQADFRGAERDMHSGAFGGSVVNVLHAVGGIITKLHDADNRVTVPGFYDDVVEPTDALRAQVAQAPFDMDSWRKNSGDAPPLTETGYTIAEATAIRPCVDVNGVWGGYQGDGAKTVIAAQAGLKLSARMVANQDPEDIGGKLCAFVEANTPDGIEVSTRLLGTGAAVTAALDSAGMRAASAALEEAYGRAPVTYRGGGSIPAVSMFQQTLGVDPVLMGFGLKTDRLHAPNEHFGIDRFAAGIQSIIRFFHHFGGQK
jgi:acetylornithine deacetylase/succinyl-diaminopimelate desuccinylase-like protein